MKYVTVDMSTKFLAFAVWEDDRLLEYGKIFPRGSGDLAAASFTDAVIKRFRGEGIDRVIYESAFLGVNVNVVKMLSKTTGAMLGGFYHLGVNEFAGVPPITWQTGIGVGKTSKSDMEKLRAKYPSRSSSWVKNKDRENRKQMIVDYVNKKHGLDLELADNDIADAVAIGDYMWMRWNNGV